MFNISAKRKNTDSYKWDAHKGTLPFGVADSDYKAPLAVRLALRKRVRQGAFGYTIESAAYKTAVADWTAKNYGYRVEAGQISVGAGVVFSINTLLQTLAQAGDAVVVQEPVYNMFFNVIENCRMKAVSSDLIFDSEKFVMDYDDLDKKLCGAKAFLFCSPHNPAGRVWSRKDVEKVVKLCKKHNVLLISDEIHCDIVFKGAEFVSAGSYFDNYENIIICNAPSKTFNLAGLSTSNVIFNNPRHKELFDKRLREMFFPMVNLMGMIAAETAYKKCAGWMRRQNRFLRGNYFYMHKYLAKHLPGAVVAEMDGTYLAFVDLTFLGTDSESLKKALYAHGVSLNTGNMYSKNYEGWVRINIACPRLQLIRGMKRIVKCCRTFLKDENKA